MYSVDFDYYRADSLATAQKLLGDHPGAKLLAGGHSLIPLMKLRLSAPPAVVDIGRVAELRGVTVTGGTVRIGALTTHAELAGSADLGRVAPALAEAAGLVGDPAVRNRGTIGGNIAHADPASDLPTVLVALGARIVAVGQKGQRTIDAAQFFTGLMTTALEDNEIVTSIEVPAAESGRGSAYVKFSHPASRYAVIGVAAAITLSDGSYSDVSVAIGGLVPHARRLPSVERALNRQAASESALAKAADAVSPDLGRDVSGDIFASAEYRTAVAPVYVKRALVAAAARAGRQ
jgi:aerobic carbon-monoxide dehydrogenase medium subunit